MEKANFLTLIESRLPPGFRFHPKDDELVGDYLVRHVRTATSSDIDSASSAAANYTSTGHGGGTNHHHHPHDQLPIMIEVDLNKCEPWELPPSARVGRKEYYFFSQRDRKYATGLRTNRATVSGYWKATGKDRQVIRCNKLIGMRKTLVFYKGRAPKGKKTDWVMHEFRLEGTAAPNPQFQLKEDWVLCRVFYKNRGVTTKSSTDHGYESETISSCSLMPQLVDHPYYNTTTNSTSHAEGVEQVPCFSNHLPPAPPPPSAYKHMITTNYHHQQQHHDQSSTHHFEGTTTSSGMFQFGENYGNSDDNAVIKAILDQLTKAEQHDHHRHLGNIGSSNNVNINNAHLKGREAIMSSYAQPASISQGAAGYYSDLSFPKY